MVLKLLAGILCAVARLQVAPIAEQTVAQLVDNVLLNTHRTIGLVGVLVGIGVGCADGRELGLTDGFNDGTADGLTVGEVDGCGVGVGFAVGY